MHCWTMFMLYSRCKYQNVKYSRLVLRLDNVGSPSCDNIGEINLRIPGTVSYWAWPTNLPIILSS